MPSVLAFIVHHDRGRGSGMLSDWLADERLALAERHAARFARAGAGAQVARTGMPFAAMVRAAAAEAGRGGLIVLGSGAVPLATDADARALVSAAAAGGRVALANNRYSADVVAVPAAAALRDLPDLPSDNALPRWLEERAGYQVRDLRDRWRLQVDLDSPLDGVLLGRAEGLPAEAVLERLAALRAIAADRSAELLVAGRTGASTLRWLEERAACRVRALVEERGLRAGSSLALGDDPGRARRPQRPPASVLGRLLEHEGPGALGTVVAGLGDGALVDSRVLLAHRLGVDEASWPSPEDRFASDLLLADRVRDPWLRALTEAAAGASVPVVLGGHSLVGPGVRLALRGRSR